jgi:hypothetical protein
MLDWPMHVCIMCRDCPALHDVRCDDRIEDFCRVLLHSNHLESLDSLKTAWGTLWACLNSDEG